MNQMESSAKQHKSYNDPNSNKFNNDAASNKHKSHLLAKYSEVSDEELDYGNDQESSGNVLFQNTNTQDIEDREKKARDSQHEVKQRISKLFDKILLGNFRHIKNNKKKINLMRIIRNKKMMNEKRKHNNAHKNKNDGVKKYSFFCVKKR
jgi:uncharacterized linocin/CFP29 family protein